MIFCAYNCYGVSLESSTGEVCCLVDYFTATSCQTICYFAKIQCAYRRSQLLIIAIEQRYYCKSFQLRRTADLAANSLNQAYLHSEIRDYLKIGNHQNRVACFYLWMISFACYSNLNFAQFIYSNEIERSFVKSCANYCFDQKLKI